MGTVTLLLGIHNHQPQGNFEEVFHRGFDDCYGRLLEAIQRHSSLRITLHYSGPLIEWIERHHPDYFDTLASLVDTGRVELMGGGFYEPMLSVLPERDALGQLQMMAEFLEGRVGRRPRGMWLAERVWEPDLPRVISSAGYRYTILDDGHFLAAGMKRPLYGYYVTDKAGLPLCVFPISMALRYSIPFRPAHEAIDQLLQIADEAGNGDLVLTYGDDGEKFGLWPGTKKWVWEERWLDQFLDLLESNADRIHTSTFSEILQRQQPSGRVYLPTASYDEMGEWALPAEAQRRFHALSHHVDQEGYKDDWGPFVRGGIWQGFLAKYPEANFMHKRMCHVSDRVARAADLAEERDDPAMHREVESARTELYRGQCNCAYWHGLFGGLYLSKLRSAVHSHLIRAQRSAAALLGRATPVEMVRLDLDGDLLDEVILCGKSIGIVVAPGKGGALLAIDDVQRAFCITDVLTRQPEAYHDKVRELSGQASRVAEPEHTPKSIHDMARLKEEGLADLLVYDPHQRLAFVDQFFAADLDLQRLHRCDAPELGDFKTAPYDLLQAAGGSGNLLLCRRGAVTTPAGEVAVSLHKSYRLEQGALVVDHEITPEQPLSSVLFATEISLAMPSGPHDDVRCRVLTDDGETDSAVTAKGVDLNVRRVEISDPLSPMTILLKPTIPATLVRFPLETASQSESGFERTYQGTTLVLTWPVEVAANATFKSGLRLQLC